MVETEHRGFQNSLGPNVLTDDLVAMNYKAFASWVVINNCLGKKVGIGKICKAYDLYDKKENQQEDKQIKYGRCKNVTKKSVNARYNAKCTKITNIETGETKVFKTVLEASKAINASTGVMHYHMNRTGIVKGYKVEYAD